MMHTNRRAFLQTLTAAGFALTGMGLAQASTGKPAAAAGQEVLAITSATHGHALEAAFVQGAQSVAARVQHSQLLGFDSASFQQLHTMLHDQQDTLLVGLLDDASATLVLDLVRSAGGRVLSEEHHRIAADATGWAHRPWSAARATLPLHSPATNPAWPCAA